MSGVHLHLLVNHAPLFGAIFALALLVISYFYSPESMRRVALITLVFTAMASAASKYTGEPAEDAVRGLPGIKREVIHEHEEMADISYYVAIVVGVIAVGALIRSRGIPVPAAMSHVGLLGALAVACLMGYTSLLGGQVRHTEVRPGATEADAMAIEPRRAPPPRE